MYNRNNLEPRGGGESVRREILEKVFEVLGIKKSTAAKILNVWDGTFSQKLKCKKKGYRLFDDEIQIIINKLIKEKIIEQKNEDTPLRVKRTQKLEELAQALDKLIQQYKVIDIDNGTISLFDNKKYADFVIKLIWLEQAAFNKIYNEKFLNTPKKALEDFLEDVSSNDLPHDTEIHASSYASHANIFKNDSTIILVIQKQDVESLLPQLLKILS